MSAPRLLSNARAARLLWDLQQEYAFTTGEMADHLGISRPYLSLIYSGKREVSLGLAMRTKAIEPRLLRAVLADLGLLDEVAA